MNRWKFWDKIWSGIRDVGGTGLGGWVIYREVYSAHPSTPLLILAGALIVPAARANLLAILAHAGGEGGGSSSTPPPPTGPSSGLSSQRKEGTGEHL